MATVCVKVSMTFPCSKHKIKGIGWKHQGYVHYGTSSTSLTSTGRGLFPYPQDTTRSKIQRRRQILCSGGFKVAFILFSQQLGRQANLLGWQMQTKKSVLIRKNPRLDPHQGVPKPCSNVDVDDLPPSYPVCIVQTDGLPGSYGRLASTYENRLDRWRLTCEIQRNNKPQWPIP